jgi:hypothetical protein
MDNKNNNAILPQEQQQQLLAPPVVIVRAADVIMGRGHSVANHPGNRRFRHTIELIRPRYESARPNKAKTLIIAEIVALVKQTGGRFVKHDQATATWSEVDNNVAKRKVGQASCIALL